MKIRSIYRHYWPDTTPYARILRAILEDRARERDEVIVLTGQPSYNDNHVPEQPRNQTIGGVLVRRYWLPRARKTQLLARAASLGLFLTRALASTMAAPRPDLLLVNSNPPVGMGLLAGAVRRLRGIPYIYHCQDIHPEALVLSGKINDGLLYRALRHVDTKTCAMASAVVVLSDDMRDTMLARGVPRGRLVVINNFPLDTYDDSSEEEVAKVLSCVPKGAFVCLFAGNIGDFQGLETVIEAAHLLRHEPEIQFVFMGAGLAQERLEALAGDLLHSTVHFVGQHSVELARATMARSHLGVVSLAPGVSRVAYPSKLMTYVASGCPVLALVEPTSAVARDVVRNELGYVCGSRDPASLAETIQLARTAVQSWGDHEREALRQRAEACFGRALALTKWSGLLGELQMPSHPPGRPLSSPGSS